MPKSRIVGMVKVRKGFSDRSQLIQLNKVQQINEIDDDTRVRINNEFNRLIKSFFGNLKDFGYPGIPFPDPGTVNRLSHGFCRDLLNDVFCKSNICDDNYIFNRDSLYKQYIEKCILDAKYNEVLDLLEYCCQWVEAHSSMNRDFFYRSLNALFEKEYVGYRFLDSIIVPITDKMELQEISDACNNPYEGTRIHMKRAVQNFSDRKAKDYKKCVEESILAVESICRIITGNDNAVLSDALKEIEKKNGMHSSLKQGFIKLYAYTSDKGGIRHADGLFVSNVSFDEAKYFLVSCSAFVNYLIAEYAKGSN